MTDFTAVLCPECAEILRAAYRVQPQSDGSMDIACHHCGRIVSGRVYRISEQEASSR